MRFASELRRKAEQIFIISTSSGTIFACCQVGRGHGNLWGWQAKWTHEFEVKKTTFFQFSHKAARLSDEELMKGNISLQKKTGKGKADTN